MSPRLALVHEWLVQRGGSELVVAQFHALFPDAPLHVLFDQMPPATRQSLALPRPHTSWMQHIPGIAQHYRRLAPLMPRAVQSLDVRSAELVLSSHHAVAKGVRLTPQQVHVCYCHSPPRYAWAQRDQYLADHGITGPSAAVARVLLNRLRAFDQRTGANVHRYIANSRTVAARIQQAYGRTSVVIPPPVDTEFFTPGGEKAAGVYVAASRFVPYKRMADIVTAFRALAPRQLVVIGDGPDRAAVERAAAGAPHITLQGEVSRDELRSQLRRAQAFVFAAEEDAGIVPIEAQACGTPVIVYARGGAAETLTAETGMTFDHQTPAAIAAAVRAFEAHAPFSSARCRANAEQFSAARFRAAIRAEVDAAWAAAQSGGPEAARR